MTNEQEVMELAKQHGAVVGVKHILDIPKEGIFFSGDDELSAFAKAIRDQVEQEHAEEIRTDVMPVIENLQKKRVHLEAQIAMLVDAAIGIFRHDDYAGQYSHLPEAQVIIAESYSDAIMALHKAVKATQPDAEAFIREKQAEVMPKWQPIETAPKDGTRVLLAIDHGEWGDKVWTGIWANDWIVSYGKAQAEPTHWMPLPAAPELRNAKEV